MGRKLDLLVVITFLALFFALPAKSNTNIIVKRKQTICKVFGKKHCREAISVADCETGGKFDIWAGYGEHEYWGLFQMGTIERKIYGHNWGAWGQARAAKRYFVASGRNWSPWTCKP